jgi:hypothetical protein
VTHILAAKGLDGGDRVLAKSVAERLISCRRMQAKRGKIAIAGKGKGAADRRGVTADEPSDRGAPDGSERAVPVVLSATPGN